jgi:hypothetical protein
VESIRERLAKKDNVGLDQALAAVAPQDLVRKHLLCTRAGKPSHWLPQGFRDNSGHTSLSIMRTA